MLEFFLQDEKAVVFGRSTIYLQKSFSKTQDKYMRIHGLSGFTHALGLSGSLQVLGARPLAALVEK